MHFSNILNISHFRSSEYAYHLSQTLISLLKPLIMGMFTIWLNSSFWNCVHLHVCLHHQPDYSP